MVNLFTLPGRTNSPEGAGIDEMTRQSFIPKESDMNVQFSVEQKHRHERDTDVKKA